MNIVKFTLGGRFAFFKKPDVNSYYYFTYGNIHKIALLGIFGAMLGYKGYNSMSFNKKYYKTNREYPEFYEKLRNIRVSIVPHNISISRKVQIFNNSVGYASQEHGGNLIVKEQWLENPAWDIYIALDCTEANNILGALVNNEYVYLPYLGKNDHMANISNLTIINDVKLLNDVKNIDSLFIKDFVEFSNIIISPRKLYKYEEMLPYTLEKTSNQYEYKSFVFTNAIISLNNNAIVYGVDDKNIAFF